MFACLCTLKKSCSKFYKEQKLFNDLELEMCTTCSKVAHMVKLGADWRLRNFLRIDFQFQCTHVQNTVVCNLGQTKPRSYIQTWSTHVALQVCYLQFLLSGSSLGVFGHPISGFSQPDGA
jgi:hypothetical protein